MGLLSVLTRRARTGMARRPRRWLTRDWSACMVRVGPLYWKLAFRRGYGITCWSFERDGFACPMWPGLSWYGDLLVIKRRKAQADAPTANHLAPVETNVFAKLMALVEHCAATKYDDGEARRPGWFTVRTRGSAWEVEIKDPDTASRLVVVQQTLDDALALAQVLLETEDAPWEPDQWLAASNARSKKK